MRGQEWNRAMMEALQYEFMRNAVAAGLLVSVACGVIGTLVVLNRIVFLSAGIAHAAYGGIGLGYLLQIDPFVSAIGFSLAAALGMGTVQRVSKERADTTIGVMWAIGMALGIVFIDCAQGYKADLMSYLFGSILAVPRSDLYLMLALNLVIVGLTVALYKELLALSFDETFATVRNVAVNRMYLLLVCMIALSVVMMMRVVGLIMVIALLTIPAAISALFVKDMKVMMGSACLLGAIFTSVGLWLSYAWDLTSGATIILVAGAAYFVALAAQGLLRAAGRREARGVVS